MGAARVTKRSWVGGAPRQPGLFLGSPGPLRQPAGTPRSQGKTTVALEGGEGWRQRGGRTLRLFGDSEVACGTLGYSKGRPRQFGVH